MLRVQPPALSPVTMGALASGLGAAVRGSAAAPRLGRMLLERFGARDVTLLDSGTSALRLAVTAALAARPGKPVGLPGWACYDVITAAQGAGARIVFYDLDPATLQPEAGSLARLADAEPAGVVVVHPWGVPVDLDAVRRAVGPAVLLIEDAAQGWGGALAERPLGSLGDFSVFSFGRGKGITGGSGGALLAVSEGAASLQPHPLPEPRRRGAGDLVKFGALLLLARPRLYGIPASLPWLRLGETVYRPPHGVGAMSSAAVAMVAAVAGAADREGEGRRARAERLRAAVEGGPLAENVRPLAGALPGWLRLPVVARDAATAAALHERGRPLGLARAYPRDLRSVGSEVGAAIAADSPLPGSIALAERLVTLPVHGLLVERDLGEIEQLMFGR
jgi:perosamine synthetase